MKTPKCPRSIRTCLLLSALVGIAPLASHAQSSANGAPLKTVNFRVMAMEGVILDTCFIQDRRIERFNASHSHPTKWLRYRGTGPINFYRANDLSNIENLEEMPKPVAQFAPPSSGNWLLLFVKSPGVSGEGNYRIVNIPENNEPVEVGIRFYNLTRKILAVNVTDEQMLLQPGDQKLINPSPGPNNGMGMKIAAKNEESWDLVSSTIFGHRPNARITIYIIDAGGEILFKRFTDAVPPPPAVAEG